MPGENTEKNAEQLMQKLEAERREKEAYKKALEIFAEAQKKKGDMSRRGFLKLLAAGTLIGGGYWLYKDLTKGKMSDEEIEDALNGVKKAQKTTQELKEALTVIDNSEIPEEQKKKAEQKVVDEVLDKPELYHDDLRRAVQEYHKGPLEEKKEKGEKLKEELKYQENVNKGLQKALERSKKQREKEKVSMSLYNRNRGRT